MCRESFSKILENQGMLPSLLENSFYPSRDLFQDIQNSENSNAFKNYIFNKYIEQTGSDEGKQKSTKTPKQLMEDAGYALFECKTQKAVDGFKKYWDSGETLCTFRDPTRIEKNLIFFAVKKDDVDEIKREDFKAPKRQDKYGTSVISIQFTTSRPNTISIKNRYNHSVDNPDSTFSNDLENIIAGLTDSFVEEYELNLVSTKNSFELPSYVMTSNGTFYKYNSEIENIYYTPNNITITNGEVTEYDKSRYLLMDNFLLDMHEKTIKNISNEDDSFTDTLKDIQKISITESNGEKKILLSTKAGPAEILLNKQNQIVGYKNEYTTTVGDRFLHRNTSLTEVSMPNLTEARDYFLYNNNALAELSIPNLTTVGNCFLRDNNSLTKLNVPNLTEVGHDFLCRNTSLTELSMPNVTTVGDDFLHGNNALTELSMLNLTEVGDRFLYSNTSLTKLNVPNLTEARDDFLHKNNALTELSMPNLTEVGHRFLECNQSLAKQVLQKTIKQKRDLEIKERDLEI